jgi:hypothetical protein
MFDYPSQAKALDIISRLHHHETVFAYSGLFTGLSGVGKTYLAQHYQSLHPLHLNREKTTLPVIYCRLKAPRTNIGLLEQLIKSLGASLYKHSSNAEELEERLIYLFVEHKVQLVLVDEVQECLTTVDGINAQRMAKQFASILDSAKLPFILLGTPSAARLLSLNYGTPSSNTYGEEQLSRRFISEYKISAVPQRRKLWLDCVNEFCKKLDVPSFTFDDKQILNRIYISTHGRLGLLQKLFDFLPIKPLHQSITMDDCMEAHDFAMNSSALNPFDINALTDDEIIDLLDLWKGK